MNEVNYFNEDELKIYEELKIRFRRYKSAVFTQDEFPKYKTTIDKLIEVGVIENASVGDSLFYLLKKSFQKYEIEINNI